LFVVVGRSKWKSKWKFNEKKMEKTNENRNEIRFMKRKNGTTTTQIGLTSLPKLSRQMNKKYKYHNCSAGNIINIFYERSFNR